MHEFYVTCVYITLGELGHEYRGQTNGQKITFLRYLAGLGLSDQMASENI